ncbi:DUF1223 domain-containing protein [Maritalea sp.]|uniref:DUF1223 domain-containing protein n=1 Tax=Maritalea sp. TaxID=2003361 RepID=UPI003EF2A875
MKKFVQIVAVAFAGVLPIVSGSALAMSIKSEPVAVLELFTSQGCSSCPPADKILSELAHDKKLITLAYHVDYWNYIGWEDTFSDEEHSNLQRGYAHQLGAERIYTPQLLINGTVDIVGSHADKIEKAIAASSLDVGVSFAVEGDMLSIEIPKFDTNIEQATIWLVPFISSVKVEIQRGENRGQTLTYSSVVKHRQIVGMWSPSNGTNLSIPMPQMLGAEVDGLAVLVQERTAKGLPGRMLGAAALTQ